FQSRSHSPEVVEKFKPLAARVAVTEYLPRLFGEVRTVLSDLFERGYASVDPSELPAPELKLMNGIVRLVHRDEEPSTWLLGDFVEILMLRPFPFGRCPVCARFFVRVRRQRYCSPECTSRGTEAGRKDQRREYMRRYMARRRSKT